MNTKKAILVVSFGTSYHETRKKTIEKIEEDLSNAFPNHTFKRAFTSQMIMNKLKKRDGLIIDNPQEALDKLVAEGFQEILVQPTHIINGSEFEGLYMELLKYKEKFQVIKLGKPLLSEVEDYIKVIQAMGSIFTRDIKDKSIILMGHGSQHHANAVYPCLDYIFKNEGYENVHIATVEGFPSLNMVINKLFKSNSEVILIPLMIVAGDHVQEDMVGDDEDSWKNILKSKGYNVSAKVIGMGEIIKIRNIFIEHCRNAIRI